jgi:hypothetical protein
MFKLAALFFASTLSLGFPSPGFAAQSDVPGFCGSVDFSRASNEALTNIVFMKDLEGLVSVPRIQCGLPGETLNICSKCSDEFPESSLQILRPILGSKPHSDWHAKWHKARMLGLEIPDAFFVKLQNAQLVPADMDKTTFIKTYGIGGKLAGENFFFMHRMMIKMVQFELAMQGKDCVAPWLQLPTKIDDPAWPVPHDYTKAGRAEKDQERLGVLNKLAAKFQSEDYLKSVSLNTLGRAVEPTLHLYLHEFYASSGGCSPESKAQGFCDDLIPVETSPLNKHFWKLHGLMDDLLGRWLKVHGYSEISTNCEDRKACYQWQATWVGKKP